MQFGWHRTYTEQWSAVGYQQQRIMIMMMMMMKKKKKRERKGRRWKSRKRKKEDRPDKAKGKAGSPPVAPCGSGQPRESPKYAESVKK